MSSNDNAAAVSDERTVRKAAERVGFFDKGIPGQLYTQWRKQVHRRIQNFNCHGPEEAGSNKWESFCEWAAGQPTMAPRYQLAYQDEAIQKHIRILYDDVVKKARGSRQAMWVAIQQARATHRASYDGESAVIEPPKWPLPDVEELGQPSAGPSYMPITAKGKRSAGVNKVTIELNVERERVNAQKRD
ncbi:hypothetical protein L211DRAFT_847247 [Terfezia boudieri ATCC MYA-4762]|uniref:Uncharacterized protein n=1 Tax=Terfezia boudieri ATCC MYA-4762 TaxID=1051890 RepID=A0A3N4M110_9PEZI|nr:hypothetical protein L211DRAFT_847247 [Terfezia boudieri ATCC MYA-4762]